MPCQDGSSQAGSVIWQPYGNRLPPLNGGSRSKVGFVFLIYLDLLLTLIALERGFTEMNPLMLRLLASPGGLVLVKGVAPLFIAWLMPAKLLLPSIALMLAVGGWNIRELLTSL